MMAAPSTGRVLVTGVAGFIGSTLADRLLSDGVEVIGVDCFRTYYDPAIKRANLGRALGQPGFTLVEQDLRDIEDLPALLSDVDHVYHLAAQPGVRLSWADGFKQYVDDNVHALQHLLEALIASPTPMTFASSSSVYGNALSYPVVEAQALAPRSPYGVTKVAGEALCSAYAANHELAIVAARFFTVYGPRQRPDMAFTKLLTSVVRGETFTMLGDGHQRRDFTYVDDLVSALRSLSTATIEVGLTPLNLGGGSDVSMRDVLALVQDIAGTEPKIEWEPAAIGDVRRTGADISLARSWLDWTPAVSLHEGLSRQYESIRTAANGTE